MARQNVTFLLGQVWKKPEIVKDDEGNYKYGMCYIQVVRGKRNIEDDTEYIKCDYPLIMTRDAGILHEMESWRECDIVSVKGSFTTKNINKHSFCAKCNERNSIQGAMAYINPIYAEKLAEKETRKEAQEYLIERKEISNQIYFIGNLTREPKKIKTEKGVIITQYQVAANRKFRISTDAPENKTDYPWVKSYGENAIEDRKRLKEGSLVFIDGIIQARNVHRTTKCPHCGNFYKWTERTMEIVPYETEYLNNYKTAEEISHEENQKLQNKLNSIFGDQDTYDTIPEDERPVE